MVSKVNKLYLKFESEIENCLIDNGTVVTWEQNFIRKNEKIPQIDKPEIEMKIEESKISSNFDSSLDLYSTNYNDIIVSLFNEKNRFYTNCIDKPLM